MERFEGLVTAKEALKNIIDNENFGVYYRIDAMLQLTDLLLIELKTFNNEDIFNEVEHLSNQVYSIGKEKNLLPVEIEASMLKAKLSIVKGDFTMADTLLKEVHSLAKNKGLALLESRISKEQERLKKELSKWIELIESNSSLKERIEEAEIESYLKEAIKILTDL